MTLGSLLIIIAVIAIVAALPTWGYSSSWGYGPVGIIGLLLAVVIVLALLQKL
jgi:hypothetical protein